MSISSKQFLLNYRSDIKIAVRGFGNVGKNAARLLYEKGYKVCAISDSNSGIFCGK
ncbi:hypothetical protein [Methanococcoides burtonii]|uniref:hypothetical protein n=1 Tax=Methanococcoides burtonii TaxID=29291 RepID=UPI0000399376